MLKQVAGEVYRVLKPGGVLGILLGGTRAGGHYVPITHYALATPRRGLRT
jgi:ubiquinone/menaquinone biosynthesis C-methylase UbiE